MQPLSGAIYTIMTTDSVQMFFICNDFSDAVKKYLIQFDKQKNGMIPCNIEFKMFSIKIQSSQLATFLMNNFITTTQIIEM